MIFQVDFARFNARDISNAESINLSARHILDRCTDSIIFVSQVSRKSSTKKRRRRGFVSSLFCCFGSRSHSLNQDIKSNGSALANHESQPALPSAEERDDKVRTPPKFYILTLEIRI